MKTGVIETFPDEKRPRKKGPLISSGGKPPRNDGGGGPNDDDNGRSRASFSRFDDDEPDTFPDKAKVVTWFLLLVVLMTFGGLIGAYIVISTNNVLEWRPFELPLPVWVSTVLIVISSFTYHAGKKALDRDDNLRSRNFFVATTVLGAMFIASQLLAWMALVNAGLYMRGNPYAGFFYILTGIHAVHVLGGIIALGAILLRVWNDTQYEPELEYRKNLARSVGWYWHFMGGLWVVLFILLGFWK